MNERPESERFEPPPGESTVERDEINAGLLGMVGAFIAVGVLLIIVLLQAWFYNWRGEITAAATLATNDPRTPLGQAILEQQQQINSYRWINREAHVRAIPIERAMELVVEEMAPAKNPSPKGEKP